MHHHSIVVVMHTLWPYRHIIHDMHNSGILQSYCSRIAVVDHPSDIWCLYYTSVSVHTFKVHVSMILLSHCVSVGAKRRERVPGNKERAAVL